MLDDRSRRSLTDAEAYDWLADEQPELGPLQALATARNWPTRYPGTVLTARWTSFSSTTAVDRDLAVRGAGNRGRPPFDHHGL